VLSRFIDFFSILGTPQDKDQNAANPGEEAAPQNPVAARSMRRWACYPEEKIVLLDFVCGGNRFL